MQGSGYQIKELGELVGKVLLFGGPYSNLQASQALKAIATQAGIPPGNRICTGDVVAYCADPAETLHFWQDICELVAGNCEKQLGAGAADCGCGFTAGSACEVLAKDWYPYATSRLADQDQKYLAEAPDIIVFTHNNQRCAVIHGGVFDIAKFLWSISPDCEFEQEIQQIQKLVGPIDRVISGHSGIAFQRQFGAVEWVNTGAIGMPANDGNPKTSYLTLDQNGIQFERLSYDHQKASDRMRQVGLVQGYEKSLISGYWPSQDILPKKLRR